MERTERFYKIVRLLDGRRSVSSKLFMDELEVSLATLKRDIDYLRNRFNAPIEFDRNLGGYRFNIPPGASRFQLPGIWFSAAEAHALLVAHQLLSNLEPGLLSAFVEPVKVRIRALLGADHSFDEVEKRIRILALGSRVVEPRHFELLSSAVLRRRQLHIKYQSRGTGEMTERDVSPQRLVHYRDNWYLDAWCHLKKDLRTFSLDCVLSAVLLDAAAKDLPEVKLDRELGAGYGIFSGRTTQTAVLKFAPTGARWVSKERWHPEQKGRLEADGTYVLEIPYADDRELLMDIMRYGANVEVIAPSDLRQKVMERHETAAHCYRNSNKVCNDDEEDGGKT